MLSHIISSTFSSIFFFIYVPLLQGLQEELLPQAIFKHAFDLPSYGRYFQVLNNLAISCTYILKYADGGNIYADFGGEMC